MVLSALAQSFHLGYWGPCLSHIHRNKLKLNAPMFFIHMSMIVLHPNPLTPPPPGRAAFHPYLSSCSDRSRCRRLDICTRQIMNIFDRGKIPNIRNWSPVPGGKWHRQLVSPVHICGEDLLLEFQNCKYQNKRNTSKSSQHKNFHFYNSTTQSNINSSNSIIRIKNI